MKILQTFFSVILIMTLLICIAVVMVKQSEENQNLRMQLQDYQRVLKIHSVAVQSLTKQLNDCQNKR